MKRHLLALTLILSLGIGCAGASSPQYIALADSADMYIKNEKWLEAEHTIVKALRLEPANFSNSLLFSNLGICRTNRGDYNGALEAYDLGLSIAPGSAVIRNNRAKTHVMMRDYDNAIADLDESLRIDSVQEWPLQTRGLLRMRNNDIEGARRDFTLLLKKFPYNFTAMEGLGSIAEAEGKHDEAIKYYDETLKMEDNPETRSARILIKINCDRYSDASADIAESIRKYPDYSDFYVWRGYLHRLNYRNEEAQADKKNALAKGADPQFVDQFIP